MQLPQLPWLLCQKGRHLDLGHCLSLLSLSQDQDSTRG
jgi:hypothetical protein